MRKIIPVICAAAAALTLSACASGGYRVGYVDGGPYDVYYDGFYGPYNGGYWGPDATFFYRDGGGHYIHDDAGHFHHENFASARGFRAERAPRG